MEKSIFQYLEFLLPIHNCVIIPEFGGFIIDIESSSFNIKGDITHPEYNIVFNLELKHNDGLIASYIVKDGNISYNAACKKIKTFVKELISDLKSGKTVGCENIGCLKTDASGNITFLSNKTFIHPNLYGLVPVKLRQLNDIEQTFVVSKRKNYFKYSATGIVAATAALLLFIGPNNAIKEQKDNSQKANFISSITAPISVKDSNKEQFGKIENTATTLNISSGIAKATPSRIYYIIIGGEENQTRANKLLNKIQSSDFPNASIIESQDRYRIYISTFEDKSEAEAFLESFRKENPKYESAWLYSKRNI